MTTNLRHAFIAPSDLRRGDVIVTTRWDATTAADSDDRWAILLVDRADRGRTRVYAQRCDGTEYRKSFRYDAGERVCREYVSVLDMLGDD